MLLYLFDAPDGSSMRILALAIVVDGSQFEHALVASRAIPSSIEFHAPSGNP